MASISEYRALYRVELQKFNQLGKDSQKSAQETAKLGPVAVRAHIRKKGETAEVVAARMASTKAAWDESRKRTLDLMAQFKAYPARLKKIRDDFAAEQAKAKAALAAMARK